MCGGGGAQTRLCSLLLSQWIERPPAAMLTVAASSAQVSTVRVHRPTLTWITPYTLPSLPELFNLNILHSFQSVNILAPYNPTILTNSLVFPLSDACVGQIIHLSFRNKM